MSKRRAPLKIKIAISLCSFIFFLGLLELGLRATGHFLISKRLSETAQPADGFTYETFNILCLGDSFTFGGLVWEYETYPARLEKLLNTAPETAGRERWFRVINQGVCDHNSHQVLKALPGWLDKHDPDLVILLVGAANRFNMQGFNRYLCASEKASFVRKAITEAGDFVLDLRITKMIRIIALNLKGRPLKNENGRQQPGTGDQTETVDNPDGWRADDPHASDRHQDTERSSKLFDSSETFIIEYLHTLSQPGKEMHSTVSREHIATISGFHQAGGTKEGIAYCNELIAQDPESLAALYGLAQFHNTSGDFITAEQFYQKALERDANYQEALKQTSTHKGTPMRPFLSTPLKPGMRPGDEQFPGGRSPQNTELDVANMFRRWAEDCLQMGRFDKVVLFAGKAMELDPSPDHMANYHVLSKAYDLQSTYELQYVLTILTTMREAHPELESNQVFMDYVDFFLSRQRNTEKRYEWLKSDVEKVVDTCQEKNLPVVLQNYPRPYNAANTTLRDVARERSLPFVQQLPSFEKLMAREGEKEYFLDEEHTTIKGCRLMAKNIFEVLVSEELIPLRQAPCPSP